jgi:VWFA-related protein
MPPCFLLQRHVRLLLLPVVLLVSQFAVQAQRQTAPGKATSAEDPPNTKTPTVSIDVKVVVLPVTVRDKHGEIVRNLTKDDFELQQDSRPQTIRYFTQETDLPLTLGLLVDTSMSQRNVLDQERSASKTFLDEMVTNKDRAFVVHFDREVELLQELTADHGKLESALQLLQTPSESRETSAGGDQDGSAGPSRRRSGTLLYDAIFLASDELMKKQTGRKAIVVLSDGVDRGSKESLGSAIEAAQRADTMVYSVYFASKEHGEGDNPFGHRGGMGGQDPNDYPGGYPGRYPGGRYPGGGYPGGGYPGGGYPGGGYPGGGYPGGGYPGGYPPGGGPGGSREPHIDGRKMLEQISRETGGRLFEVSKKETIDAIYKEIAEELRTQYMMGYTPEKSDVEGFHTITLTAKRKDLTVQTRTGYYADH